MGEAPTQYSTHGFTNVNLNRVIYLAKITTLVEPFTNNVGILTFNIFKSYYVIHIHVVTIFLLLHIFNYSSVSYLVRITCSPQNEVAFYVVQFQRLLYECWQSLVFTPYCAERFYVEPTFPTSVFFVTFLQECRKKKSPDSIIVLS